MARIRPGPTAEAIQYLIDKGIIGWGSETVGTDAGSAGGMNPPFPAHNLMHKNNRYGLASLCNLDKLPPKGAVIIAAPLEDQAWHGQPAARAGARRQIGAEQAETEARPWPTT